FTGAGCVCLIECAFPPLGDFDRKRILGFWRSTDFPVFIHGTIEGMPVNRGGAGIQPHAWRFGASTNRLTQRARTTYPRVQDLAPVSGVITAIDRLARQIDYRGCALPLLPPRTDSTRVPPHVPNRVAIS